MKLSMFVFVLRFVICSLQNKALRAVCLPPIGRYNDKCCRRRSLLLKDAIARRNRPADLRSKYLRENYYQ